MSDLSGASKVLGKDTSVSENYQHGPKLLAPGDLTETNGAN
jgi:hypothetical protein